MQESFVVILPAAVSTVINISYTQLRSGVGLLQAQRLQRDLYDRGVPISVAALLTML